MWITLKAIFTEYWSALGWKEYSVSFQAERIFLSTHCWLSFYNCTKIGIIQPISTFMALNAYRYNVKTEKVPIWRCKQHIFRKVLWYVQQMLHCNINSLKYYSILLKMYCSHRHIGTFQFSHFVCMRIVPQKWKTVE